MKNTKSVGLEVSQEIYDIFTEYCQITGESRSAFLRRYIYNNLPMFCEVIELEKEKQKKIKIITEER